MSSILICLFLQEYLNIRGGTHAEIKFINDRSNNPNDITTLWIKNAPCAKCSRALLEYFESHRKPTIYVGRIWRLDNENDKQGLINLIKAGFKIKIWEELHNMMYRSSTKTKNYLKEIEKQARNNQHNEF